MFAFHGFACSIQRDFYFKKEKKKKVKVLGEILMFRAFIREIGREAFKCVSACTKVTAQTN